MDSASDMAHLDTAQTASDSGIAPPVDSGDSAQPESPPLIDVLDLTWTKTGPARARELRHLSVHPGVPTQVYVSSARSGLFVSNTAPPHFDRFSGGRHFYTPVLIPVQDPNTRLVSGGTQLWISRDAGETWDKRTPNWPESDLGIWSPREVVTGLTADASRIVLCDNLGRVWVSTDVGEHFTHVGTVPFSDAPGSKHGEDGDVAFWSVKGTNALLLDADVFLVAWDNGSVFRTADGGTTWEEVLSGSGYRHAMVRSGDTIYIGMADGVYTSTDDGRTFVRDEDAPAQCYGLSGEDRVLALVCDEQLWLRTDESYRAVETSEEVHSVAVAPSDPDTVYVGMMEGLLWSNDGGASFTHSHKGLRVEDMYVVSAHPEASSHLLGGTTCSNGMYRSEDRGESWTAVPSVGHYTMLIRHAPTLSDRVYVTNSPLPSHGDLLRSNDAGRSFETIEIPDGETNHPHALAVHPLDADTLLIGTSDDLDEGHPPRLYRSEDAGETWTQIGTGFSDAFMAFMTLEIDPSNPSVIFAGTGPGGTEHSTETLGGSEGIGSGDGLWRSMDGGETFVRVTGGLHGDQVWDVEVSPDGRLYAGTDKGLFRSADLGMNWVQLIEMEDAERVEVAFDPSGANLVAVSEYAGLWLSADGGTEWQSFWTGFAEEYGSYSESIGVSDVDFSADGTTLYMASMKKGVWRADVAVVSGSADTGDP